MRSYAPFPVGTLLAEADRTPPPVPKDDIKCILVTDKDSKVLKTGPYQELKTLAGVIRSAGGGVTIFKSTRG